MARGPRIIAHVCNDIGGWGRGFVLALSARWPEPEAQYRAWAHGDGSPFGLGRVQLVQVEPDLYVANMVAQHGIRADGGIPPIRYAALGYCMETVARHALELGASLHCPRFGAGLAGGDWKRIEHLIMTHWVLAGIDVTIYDLPAR